MKKQLVLLTLLSSLPYTASSKVYFGGKAGISSLSNSCSISSPCEKNSTGYGGYLGYQFVDAFALEFGYDKFGDFKSNYSNNGAVDTLKGALTAYSIAPKLNFNIDEGVDFFLKIGAANSNYDLAKNDWNFLGAVGLENKINEALRLRAEYQLMTEIDSAPADGTNADMFSLGLSYYFGAKENTTPIVKAEPRPAVKPVPAAPVVVEKTPEPPKKQTITVQSKKDVSLFETASSKLSEEGVRRFESIATLLTTYPQSNVDVVGHTDSRGSAKYNLKLSEERAQSVADYLIEQGVKSSRITVKGEGESNPIASNDTVSGRQENRRVEVTIEEFTVEE